MIKNSTLQIVIDTIPNPAIITNGDYLLQCNQNFLNFFGMKDLEEFLKYTNCVCSLFINHEDYFSLEKIDGNILWTDYLNTKYEKYEKYENVSLIDLNGEPCAFKVTLKKLKELY